MKMKHMGSWKGRKLRHFDLIKCGECNVDFALADIVKFIEHKRKCYPRTDHIQLVASAEEEDDASDGKTETEEARETTEKDDDQEDVTIMDVVVRSEKPKIITPIKRISSTSSGQRDPISPRVKQTQTQTSGQ